MVAHDESFCRAMLPRVSRTFALNIPLLPAPLDLVVTVAYLVTRISDTLEDELHPARQAELFGALAELVRLKPGWEARARDFVRLAGSEFRAGAPEAEVELVAGTVTVLRTLASLPSWAHPPIARCVRIMAGGMNQIQRRHRDDRPVLGLPDLQTMLAYCYFVAGVVGEMLTELFIAHSPSIDEARRARLRTRSIVFGEALQLTNILKDVREDLDQGRCWMPLDRMALHGLEHATLALPSHRERAMALHSELVVVARRALDEALDYTLTIPTDEPGIRLFCLYPLFFAVKTLQLVDGNPAVFDPAPVKLGREEVMRLMRLTQERVASDAALRALFAECSREPSEVEARR
ncbi:squalene/phytoene synthase family protein [Myxococcus sp. K38C18041901]|uniref:phytoene/squalene synthase family protein n=1 Tax=Myxococcus guangdongensis TaxID=2906760 RepID=UPI0020A6ECA8|nr:squalene/phytoene synthase family protein [Myxococcus guangdongensis]MCP3061313.1 squalene/phytoene synthase family protein [Myxococcus guangdongensis]